MTRALREALDSALLIQPDLMEAAKLRERFPRLIGKCVVAINEIRLGNASERDLVKAVYGAKEVSDSSLRRLITRTQRALEAVTRHSGRGPSDETNREAWMSILHLYNAGIDAFFLMHDHRTQERLSSVLTAARDPFMLPLAASSGVFLSMFQAHSAKHSQVLSSLALTKKAIDALNDCWEWMTIYFEVQSIMRQRYRVSTFHERLDEISEMLEALINGNIDELSPQAQMVAASCAYVLSQYRSNPSSITEWAAVYRRASTMVNRNSVYYREISDRMFLRAYMSTRNYEKCIPLLESFIAREALNGKQTGQPVDATYHAWLAQSLLATGCFHETAEMISKIDPNSLQQANENVRQLLIIQRSLALGMSRDVKTPVDRRVIRLAVQRNVSGDRRSDDHFIRIAALYAMLVHARLRGSVSTYGSAEVADKLLLLHKTYKDVRNCARTSAFIRLVATLESIEFANTPPGRRALVIMDFLSVIKEDTNSSHYELAPYHTLIDQLYADDLKELKPPTRRRRRKKTPVESTEK